ncbi:MAG TPA: helix-turn-helix transcriptional regulator [Tepidisphaeraceae bacterium]|jgi:DNA-binding XRE family transcriptional regulator
MAKVTSHSKLTPQKLAELQALGKKIDAEEKDAIIAKGRAVFRRQEVIKNLITQIKTARQARNLTLTTVAEITGIGKANLSRLENEASPNPTMDTLLRYADVVGVKVEIIVMP